MSFKYDALPSFEERLCHSLTSNRTTSLALFTTPLPCATKEEPHAAIVEQSRLGNAGETGPQREGCLRIASQAELLVAADLNKEHLVTIIIDQKSSWTSLGINRELLNGLKQHFELPTQVEELLIYFGPEFGESYLSPPPAYTHTPEYVTDQDLPETCAYALRVPELHGRSESNKYSLRQFLIYHRTLSQDRSPSMIFTGTATSIKSIVLENMAETANSQCCQPWSVHHRVFGTLAASWRQYLCDLSWEIDIQTSTRAIHPKYDGNSPELHSRFELRCYLKQLEESLAECILNLTHSRQTLCSLQDYFTAISCRRLTAPCALCGKINHTLRFKQEYARLNSYLDNFVQQIEYLTKRVNATARLVSNTLDLDSSAALNSLAKESATETSMMRQLATKSTQDAAAVKVLTVLALIYLPFTVVMNFFSTEFVQSSGTSGSAASVTVASNWWLCLIIGAPLTMLTLYLWHVFVRREVHGTWPKWCLMCVAAKRRTLRALQTACAYHF